MKVLIPSNFSLLSSTVPVDEAQMFTHRVYAIGDKVVYGNLLYQRLTAIDSFPAFDNKKTYIDGETSNSASVNYIFQKQTDFPTPAVDTANWQSVATSAWAINTVYAAGSAITYKGNTYVCISSHTSPAVENIKDWLSGQPYSYYTGGVCRYNGKYYRAVAWTNIYYNSIAPSTYYFWGMPVWADITNTILYPAYSSMHWMDISNQLWSGSILYSAGSSTIFNGIIYKALNNIVYPLPASDTVRWMVSATSLPTNTTDWQNLGAINRFRMFDQYLSTYTFFNGDIDVSITDVDFNAVYVGNLFADSVTISVIDNTTSAVVETKTIDLTYDCVDEFDYFFGDWMDYRIPTVKYERTSVYNNVSCQMNFNGDFIRVGIFSIGKSYFIGTEPWEPEIEALDFSTVIEDTATGEVYLSAGNELKVKSIDLWVDTNRMMATDNILKRVRGIPAIYYSSNENLDTYGFIRKKIEILKNPTKSLISIEIRELL